VATWLDVSRCHLERRYENRSQFAADVAMPAPHHSVFYRLDVLGPGHIVLDRDPAPPHGKGHSSPSLLRFTDAGNINQAHVHCGQTVRWIRIPLRTDVGLGPGSIASDGDPAPSTLKGHSSPHFSAHFALAWLPISGTAELFCYIATNTVTNLVNVQCEGNILQNACSHPVWCTLSIILTIKGISSEIR